MSQGLNKTQIIGYLGRDPESNTTQSGVTVTRFSVGVTERWHDRDNNEQEHTESYRVVAFNGAGEVCAKFLGEGRLVYVEGRLRTTSCTARNDQMRTSTELIATSVIFLDAPRTGEEPRDSKSRPAKPNTGVDAEDVPF